jgi:hypothetical protein
MVLLTAPDAKPKVPEKAAPLCKVTLPVRSMKSKYSPEPTEPPITALPPFSSKTAASPEVLLSVAERERR